MLMTVSHVYLMPIRTRVLAYAIYSGRAISANYIFAKGVIPNVMDVLDRALASAWNALRIHIRAVEIVVFVIISGQAQIAGSTWLLVTLFVMDAMVKLHMTVSIASRMPIITLNFNIASVMKTTSERTALSILDLVIINVLFAMVLVIVTAMDESKGHILTIMITVFVMTGIQGGNVTTILVTAIPSAKNAMDRKDHSAVSA